MYPVDLEMVSIERRVSQFSTICAKIGELNLVVDKVTVLLGTNHYTSIPS